MKKLSALGILPLFVGILLFTTSAQAQRGGGGFDRSQIMDRMAERYQEALEVSDDEWSVLKPMVISIVEKQFSGRSSRFAGFGGRGGSRGGRGDGNGDRGDRNRGNRGDRGDRGDRSRGSSSSSDLSEAIESGNDAKIKSELAAYRAERKKADADLKKARNELRQLLTLKQEARMVLMGLLD